MRIKNEKTAGVFLTYVNMGLGFIVPIFYTPIMLRLLGQADYGLYGLSTSVINYLGLLTLGLGSAIVRYLMQCRAKKDNASFSAMTGLFLMLYLIIAAAALIVGVVLTFFTGTLFAHGLSPDEIQKLNVLLIILSFGTAISFISSVFSSLITCFERYFFLRILVIISTILTPFLNILVLCFGTGSVGIALVNILFQCITCIIYIVYCRKALGIKPSFRNMPFDQLKSIFKYSGFVFIGLIADMLYWATDKVMIGAMMSTLAVAVYNVGGTFQAILQNMSSAISNVFTPEINRQVVEKAPIETLSATLIRIGRIQYLPVSLLLSGFTVFGRAFITLWAGPGYEEAYVVAMLTMIPLGVPLIQSIAFTIIKAQGTHQFRSVLYVVLAIANAVSTFLLIPPMGIIGAALCTCVVFVLGHGIIMNLYYYKSIKLDIPKFWVNILQLSFVPAVMITIGLILVNTVLPINSLWALLGGAAVFTAIFFLLSWLLSMNRYEKDLALSFIRKILPKKG